MFQRWMLIAAGILWLVSSVGGTVILLRYASTAGERGDALSQWPANSKLILNGGVDTLIVAIHPHCPCTRASLVELNDLMLGLRGKVKTYVLVIKPKEFPVGWDDTDLVSSARRIPDTTIMVDLDGVEAARFGAQTSGQSILYNDKGELLFNGGITEGRGHIGDNAGLQRIIALVKTGKADKNDSLVFGCPLNAKSCPMEKADTTQTDLKGMPNDKAASL